MDLSEQSDVTLKADTDKNEGSSVCSTEVQVDEKPSMEQGDPVPQNTVIEGGNKEVPEGAGNGLIEADCCETLEVTGVEENSSLCVKNIEEPSSDTATYLENVTSSNNEEDHTPVDGGIHDEPTSGIKGEPSLPDVVCDHSTTESSTTEGEECRQDDVPKDDALVVSSEPEVTFEDNVEEKTSPSNDISEEKNTEQIKTELIATYEISSEYKADEPTQANVSAQQNVPPNEPKSLTDSASIKLTSHTEQSSSIYHLKWFEWKGERTPIVTQNENGPCPLLAIANVLILARKIVIPNMQEIISGPQLMEYIGDCIFAEAEALKERGEENSEILLNYEQNMHDSISIMYKLQTGMDVNVKFSGKFYHCFSLILNYEFF